MTIRDGVRNGLRPEIPKDVPETLAKLMRACWDQDPKKRPTMSEVVAALEPLAAGPVGTPSAKSPAFDDIKSYLAKL